MFIAAHRHTHLHKLPPLNDQHPHTHTHNRRSEGCDVSSSAHKAPVLGCFYLQNPELSVVWWLCVHTQHPGQNHPLHHGGRGPLHVQVGAGDVLRGQQQQEEKGQVGCGVTDELDEGLLDEVSQSALRSQQVDLSGKESFIKTARLASFALARCCSLIPSY